MDNNKSKQEEVWKTILEEKLFAIKGDVTVVKSGWDLNTNNNMIKKQ